MIVFDLGANNILSSIPILWTIFIFFPDYTLWPFYIEMYDYPFTVK